MLLSERSVIRRTNRSGVTSIDLSQRSHRPARFDRTGTGFGRSISLPRQIQTCVNRAKLGWCSGGRRRQDMGSQPEDHRSAGCIPGKPVVVSHRATSSVPSTSNTWGSPSPCSPCRSKHGQDRRGLSVLEDQQVFTVPDSLSMFDVRAGCDLPGREHPSKIRRWMRRRCVYALQIPKHCMMRDRGGQMRSVFVVAGSVRD